jgi:phospholipase D3/4
MDILAQCRHFLSQPNNMKSGDYGFLKRFGPHEGCLDYKALEKAADRKIKIKHILGMILELSVSVMSVIT